MEKSPVCFCRSFIRASIYLMSGTAAGRRSLSFKKLHMKKNPLLLLLFVILTTSARAQLPCSLPEYRQFDFWLGEWEVFGKNGQKAGDSKVTLLLDSCVILEEWTSASVIRGLRFAGKSFNTWNAATRQWQQTWVDNTGGSNEYLEGRFESNSIILLSRPFPVAKDSLAIRRITFTNLSAEKMRQHGEISKDNGVNWSTEYDLEYRRKK